MAIKDEQSHIDWISESWYSNGFIGNEHDVIPNMNITPYSLKKVSFLYKGFWTLSRVRNLLIFLTDLNIIDLVELSKLFDAFGSLNEKQSDMSLVDPVIKKINYIYSEFLSLFIKYISFELEFKRVLFPFLYSVEAEIIEKFENFYKFDMYINKDKYEKIEISVNQEVRDMEDHKLMEAWHRKEKSKKYFINSLNNMWPKKIEEQISKEDNARKAGVKIDLLKKRMDIIIEFISLESETTFIEGLKEAVTLQKKHASDLLKIRNFIAHPNDILDLLVEPSEKNVETRLVLKDIILNKDNNVFLNMEDFHRDIFSKDKNSVNLFNFLKKELLI